MDWGFIQPGDNESNRVRLDLQLVRAVRAFNEMVFPGIGSVFFVRQISWSVIGLSLAEMNGKTPSRVAEAVEALACWIALFRCGTDYVDSQRIRGKRKLGIERGFDYSVWSLRKNYVSQPIRMGTTAALVGLDLALGTRTRFNSLKLTAEGRSLAGLLLRIQEHSAGDWLLNKWMSSSHSPTSKIPDPVKRILLPGGDTANNQDGATELERRLIRRQLKLDPVRFQMLNAMLEMDASPGASKQTNDRLIDLIDCVNPPQGKKLRAAFDFEDMRSKALLLVKSIATQISGGAATLKRLALSERIVFRLEHLQDACKILEASMKHADVSQKEASDFICEQLNDSAEERIRSLVRRLPQVLTINNEDLVIRGTLFKENLVLTDEEELLSIADSPDDDISAAPARLIRAYMLMQDCQWKEEKV